jgi:hypothetical protein
MTRGCEGTPPWTDESTGAEQARRLLAALRTTGLETNEVRRHYFRLSGSVNPIKAEAQLHHARTGALCITASSP